MLLNLVLWIGRSGPARAGGSGSSSSHWPQYRQLKATQANLRRYDDWRGGRLIEDSTKTGADVMRDLLRHRIQLRAAAIIAGIVLITVGFIIR